jgi:hypothetical protein
VACGRGGKDESGESEHGEDREVHGAARGPGAARRRRAAYAVTSTAA